MYIIQKSEAKVLVWHKLHMTDQRTRDHSLAVVTNQRNDRSEWTSAFKRGQENQITITHDKASASKAKVNGEKLVQVVSRTPKSANRGLKGEGLLANWDAFSRRPGPGRRVYVFWER